MQNERTNTTMVKAVKAREVALYTGEEAWRLLGNEEFLVGWDALYDACPWATLFQSRSFVTTWYRTYQATFVPIVVAATYGGKLTGLLTLTTPVAEFNRKRGRIVGAGKFDAAYQNWLAEAAEGERFIQEALDQVMKALPAFSIHLKYISGSAPLQWVKASAWQSRCLIEAHSRPLMDMNDPALDKVLNKAEFRRKINRLKRLGEIEFRRITCKEEFEVLLKELTVMYDFRQGAKFNLNQFKNDPLRVAFIRALFEQQLSYFTVLRVKGQLFAAICGVAEKDWMYFACGFITHSPFRAKYYSPGFVQITLLSQLLAKDGMSVIDLTAGGDFYKSRMATRHDVVHELMLTNSRLYFLKRALRLQYFKMLEKAGKWPMGTMLAMRKRSYLLKARLRQVKQQGVFAYMVEKAGKWLHTPQESLYTIASETLPPAAAFSINKNSLSDMLCFEAKGTWVSRWEFLEDAMERYEHGECSYTYAEEGRLLGCVWVKETPEGNADPNSNSPIKVMQLQQLYCHPLGQARQKAFLAAVATALAKEEKQEMVYALAPGNDKTLGMSLETLGFKRKIQ